MDTTTAVLPPALSAALAALCARDRAVLAALAAGRGTVVGSGIVIDGLPLSDQFLAARLRAAGLLDLPSFSA